MTETVMTAAPHRTPATEPGQRARHPAMVVLIGLLLMRCGLIFAGDGVAYAAARAIGLPRPWAIAVASSDLYIVVVDLITLGVLAGLVRAQRRRLRDLVGRFTPPDALRGLLAFAIVLVGFLAATCLGNLAVYQGAPPVVASGWRPSIPFAVWTLLVMPVTVALAEEVLYRGYLQPELTSRIGRWPALVLVACGFGLQHAGLSASSGEAVLARVLTTFLVGMVLGLLRWRFRGLWPLIIAHWLVDALFLGVPVLVVAIGRV